MDSSKDPLRQLKSDFKQSKEVQELFIDMMIKKFWYKAAETINVDAMVCDIISKFEIGDYLIFDEEDAEDKDSLRRMVLDRLGFNGTEPQKKSFG